MTDPQTFTRAHQAQRDAERDFTAFMERLYGPTPPSYTLTKLGRTVVATLLALGLLFLAGLGEGGSPPQMSVDVARGTE